MATAPLIPLSRRVEAALAERRYPQALELAKQNALQKPDADSQALLRRCFLVSVQHHIDRDAFRDAHQLLTEAEKLPYNVPEWWQRLAELRADLGDFPRALQLIEKTNEPTLRGKLLGRIADRAMRENTASGKKYLPPDLHASYDVICQAFTAYEAAKEDQARELLNGIGLTSPFLEWKLMLRGLMAWHARDDAKAQENWNRLTADRLPARMVEPIRLSIDRTFATSIPADRLPVVQQQSEKLHGGLADGLRRLRKQLATEQMLPEAFKTVRQLLPEIKRQVPDALPKIANIFYWAVVAGGQPSDMQLMTSLFGGYADDPQFLRLQALVMENIGDPFAAHEIWRRYAEGIEKQPQRWPNPQGTHARAILYDRMGQLAKDIIENEDDGFDDGFIDDFMFGGPFAKSRRGRPPAKTKKVPSFTPEECYRKSFELAPTRVQGALNLMEVVRASGDVAKAKALVDQLVVQFPKNLAILEHAIQVYDSLADTPQTQKYLRDALAINPLDRKLQYRVALISLNQARRAALAADQTALEQAFAEVKLYGDTTLAPVQYALKIALAHQAKDSATATTLEEELFRLPGLRVAGAYHIMVEMSRLKIAKKLITPYSNGFTDGMKKLSVEEMNALLQAKHIYEQEPTPYYGMKSHVKKIQDCLRRVVKEATSQADILEYCFLLHKSALWRDLRPLADRGTQQYADDAHFTFFFAEADLCRRRARQVPWHLGRYYLKVREKMDACKDQRYDRLKVLFEQRRKESPDLEEAMNPNMGWGW